ncbi:Tat pathway signal protein, partial [Streptomyces sp. NPDC003860]
MARTRNSHLAAVIKETGWSQSQMAAHVVRVAAETGVDELTAVSRSHIAMWVSGTRPSGRAVPIVCETLSRKLGRVVTPADIGLGPADEPGPVTDVWESDTLSAITSLGGTAMDHARRKLLASSAYSVAAAALPATMWWDRAPENARARRPLSTDEITPAHVEAVRETAAFFSRRDQRFGGRAGRAALAAYLHHDVTDYLGGRFT